MSELLSTPRLLSEYPSTQCRVLSNDAILNRFLNKLSSLQWEESTTKQEMVDEQKIRWAIKKEYDER